MVELIPYTVGYWKTLYQLEREYKYRTMQSCARCGRVMGWVHVPTAVIWLIVENGRIVGCIAAVEDGGKVGVEGHHLADFFVRKSAKATTAHRALTLALQKWRGLWNVEVFGLNHEGLRFARAALRRFSEEPVEINGFKGIRFKGAV